MGENQYNLENFCYPIAPELIAQEPAHPRDSSNLLVLSKSDGKIQDKKFWQVSEFFSPGDVLVLNNTKVIPARLLAGKKTGAKIEILLLKEVSPGRWQALLNPSKRIKPGDALAFSGTDMEVLVKDKHEDGSWSIQFSQGDISKFLEQYGSPPLPPYIKQKLDDPQKYQTVYAKTQGAVAAPTAGLHFTQNVFDSFSAKGVNIVFVTLHCGLATFRPIKSEDIREHPMACEWVDISQESAQIINRAKQDGKKIVAVGTTCVRSLESAAVSTENRLNPFQGETKLYITPGYKFKIVDAIITNFHTPASTNLVLVSSFAGTDLIRKSYLHAISQNYRFFSFGDAMLIT